MIGGVVMYDSVSWLVLITIAGALVVGVVIAAVLVGNRHTQGVAKAIGLFLVVLVVGVVGLRYMAAPRQMQMPRAYSTAHQEHLRQMAEQQASHFTQLAENFEQQGGADAQQVAAQYRQQAQQFLAEHDTTDTITSAGSSTRLSVGVGIISPFMVLLFLGAVFMIFKYFGPGVGFAALALPMVMLFFGYASLRTERTEQARSMHASNEARVLAPQAIEDRAIADMAIPVNEIQIEPTLFDEETTDEGASAAEVAVDEEAATEEASDEQRPSEDPIAEPPASLPDDVPDWVRQPPKSVQNVYRVVVESSWHADQATCEREVQQKADLVVQTYLRELAIEENRGPTYVPPLDRLGITPRYIRENIYSESESPYLELRDFALDKDMKNLHLLLEFESADTQDLLARWRRYERQQRVGGVAAMLGGVLATLAGALGLIKLDTYTKGYYTKRLFIGVPLAIIGIIMLLGNL